MDVPAVVARVKRVRMAVVVVASPPHPTSQTLAMRLEPASMMMRSVVAAIERPDTPPREAVYLGIYPSWSPIALARAWRLSAWSILDSIGSCAALVWAASAHGSHTGPAHFMQ